MYTNLLGIYLDRPSIVPCFSRYCATRASIVSWIWTGSSLWPGSQPHHGSCRDENDALVSGVFVQLDVAVAADHAACGGKRGHSSCYVSGNDFLAVKQGENRFLQLFRRQVAVAADSLKVCRMPALTRNSLAGDMPSAFAFPSAWANPTMRRLVRQ